LPDAGAIIALADVATDRLYVVVESEEGTLHLLLSDAIAREALGSPDAAVRLALRRTVRMGAGDALDAIHHLLKIWHVGILFRLGWSGWAQHAARGL
jgi:hypothetical protein